MIYFLLLNKDYNMHILITSSSQDLLWSLPIETTVLDCSCLGLIALPELKHLIHLKELYCYNNNLTHIPTLPQNIKKLYCFKNNLTELDCFEYSIFIEEIYCQNNKIINIPKINMLPYLKLFNGARNKFDKRIVDIMTKKNIELKYKITLLELNNLFDRPLRKKNIFEWIRSLL